MGDVEVDIGKGKGFGQRVKPPTWHFEEKPRGLTLQDGPGGDWNWNWKWKEGDGSGHNNTSILLVFPNLVWLIPGGACSHTQGQIFVVVAIFSDIFRISNHEFATVVSNVLTTGYDSCCYIYLLFYTANNPHEE